MGELKWRRSLRNQEGSTYRAMSGDHTLFVHVLRPGFRRLGRELPWEVTLRRFGPDGERDYAHERHPTWKQARKRAGELMTQAENYLMEESL